MTNILCPFAKDATVVPQQFNYIPNLKLFASDNKQIGVMNLQRRRCGCFAQKVHGPNVREFRGELRSNASA
jgi:hypothetical protein